MHIIIRFAFSFIISVYIIVNKINQLSFWVLYHIIISGITKIELNLIIIDYEYLSNKRSTIVFYMAIVIYMPFILIYVYIKFIPSIEIKYITHVSRALYLVIYLVMLSIRLNHNDFAYSTFLDIVLPNIIQKCLEFGTFFAQYIGYFYDFFFIDFICILLRIFIIVSPISCTFYIKSSQHYMSFIMLSSVRLIVYFCITYYFGSYLYIINYIIRGISFRCFESFWILIRVLNIIQIIQIKPRLILNKIISIKQVNLIIISL
jgi:hypothetical protein